MKIIMILTEALSLFKNLVNDLRGKRSLVYLLILAFSVVIASGLILYLLDPNIHSLFDGIWSAWVTMTLVAFSLVWIFPAISFEIGILIGAVSFTMVFLCFLKDNDVIANISGLHRPRHHF